VSGGLDVWLKISCRSPADGNAKGDLYTVGDAADRLVMHCDTARMIKMTNRQNDRDQDG
jgi:hypothetical protein